MSSGAGTAKPGSMEPWPLRGTGAQGGAGRDARRVAIPRGALLAIVFLALAAPAARADGFGWYGYTLRHQALAEAFGNRYRDEGAAAPVLGRAREELAQVSYDVDLAVDVLAGLLREGWRTGRSGTEPVEQWALLHDLASAPGALPELAFGVARGMVSMQAIEYAVDAASRRDAGVLRLFDFGRPFGAREPHAQCPGAPPQWPRRPGGCSPVYFLLSPTEVVALRDAIAPALAKVRRAAAVPDGVADELVLLGALVDEAASNDMGLFFAGFD